MARITRCGAAILLAALMFSPCRAVAHVEEAPQQERRADPFPRDEGPVVGVDERLGAKIPLDATFRDETGRQVRLGELITGPTIIVPVYYGCANVCNYLQGGLARVLPTLKNRPATEYRVISVSFDESETPQLAARYKRMYLTAMKVPFPEAGWRFLTGDTANIRRVTDAAGYRFQRRGRDFIHPVTTLVVAGDGTIVRYLYGTTFLAKDVSLALLEARQGKAGASIRKVMEFCFSFDSVGKTYVFNLLRVSATVVILCAGGFLAFLLLGGKKRRKTGTQADAGGRD
ncbi:SCO family protein [Geobacter sp. FeAm09]|uniref:SCO family protein n=1 Tax=Geobacter sp. FeAm09 TaxID=2597769 RepID=UPI0011EF2218|nr:SCO family protein [Geobacter sp. FeAm09]QEM69296.1 SCO family protein [Geobacter sp. FeAm09]